MKRYILLALTTLLLFSCDKDNIERFSGERLLYFSMRNQDSVFLSFSHYPNDNVRQVACEVQLVGDPLDEPMGYNLEIVDSLTTATTEDYELDLNPVFPSHQIKDTIYITLKRTARLQDDNCYLVFTIKENEVFQPGFVEQRLFRVVFDDMPSQPLWWDDEIERVYLGEYSPLKYSEFIRCTGVTDLTDLDPSKKRALALEFKDYIALHNLPLEVPII